VRDVAAPLSVGRAWAGFASRISAAAEPKATGPVVYPGSGRKPVYSLSPMMSGDGRLFRAVQASADLRFDRPAADAVPVPDPAGAGECGAPARAAKPGRWAAPRDGLVLERLAVPITAG